MLSCRVNSDNHHKTAIYIFALYSFMYKTGTALAPAYENIVIQIKKILQIIYWQL